jgi:hypothetical protein
MTNPERHQDETPPLDSAERMRIAGLLRFPRNPEIEAAIRTLRGMVAKQDEMDHQGDDA